MRLAVVAAVGRRTWLSLAVDKLQHVNVDLPLHLQPLGQFKITEVSYLVRTTRNNVHKSPLVVALLAPTDNVPVDVLTALAAVFSQFPKYRETVEAVMP